MRQICLSIIASRPKSEGKFSQQDCSHATDKHLLVFKLGDYPAAIAYYTAAIIADRTDATFPLNRATAYLKLGKYVGIARTEDLVLFSTFIAWTPRRC